MDVVVANPLLGQKENVHNASQPNESHIHRLHLDNGHAQSMQDQGMLSQCPRIAEEGRAAQRALSTSLGLH